MGWMQVAQMVASLVGVLGLMFFMFYILKKVSAGGGLNVRRSGSKLRIIDRAVTGRDSALIVVSVSGKLMLLGVSMGKTELLCELDISEEDYFGPEEAAPSMSFMDALKTTLGKGAGKPPDKQPNGSLRDYNTDVTDENPEGEEQTVESDDKKSID